MANTEAASTPKVGTPRCFFRKAAGNRPSLAAAYGDWALISVQPLRAPTMETTAAIAMTVPPHWPPNMALTASENGALESTSLSCATVPKTETVPRR